MLDRLSFETLEVAGILSALLGMRNPKNSRYLSDTYSTDMNFPMSTFDNRVVIGDNDMKLAKQLTKAGSEHRKYLRQIQVWVDVTMPRYWWAEMDTYKFGVKNSASTMHKLFNKNAPINESMFYYNQEDSDYMRVVIDKLNELRLSYLRAIQNKDSNADEYLVRAKQILPESFLQLRTWNTNYEELGNIYNQRKRHRLKVEWQDKFCKWCESLPYFYELLALDDKKEML